MTKTLGAKVPDTDYDAFDKECVNRKLMRSQVLRHLIRGFVSGRFRIEINESEDDETEGGR